MHALIYQFSLECEIERYSQNADIEVREKGVIALVKTIQ